MPSRSTPGPHQRRWNRALGPLALAAALLLGGCSSDEASSSRTARSPARGPDTTTDSGSRFLDAAGPVGGLTVETPPVTPPQGGERLAGRP
jgi:hypothetical protein